jgi:membrane protease YdiL (CAAX protease family)
MPEERAPETPLLPSVVWLVPWAGLILLPSAGQGPVGSRLGVLFAELMMGLPLLLATPRALRSAIMPFPPLSRGWKKALLLAPPLALAYQQVHQWLSGLLPDAEAAEEVLRRALTPGNALEGVLIGSSLLAAAPVMEELFFRGLLPWLWERRWRRGALAGPALIFALAHASLRALPSLLLLGLLLGWLRRRSGSLLPGMLLHAAVNLSGFLHLLLLPELPMLPS